MLALLPPKTAADNIAEAALYSIHNAQAMLRNGFTTIRDVGGGAGIDLALRNAIANGAIVGPRMLAAGPSLSITGGHGDTNDLPEFVHVDSEIESGVSYGPYGFRERVREHVKRHVDVIKILATGGVLSYGDVWDIPQFNLDEVEAVRLGQILELVVGEIDAVHLPGPRPQNRVGQRAADEAIGSQNHDFQCHCRPYPACRGGAAYHASRAHRWTADAAGKNHVFCPRKKNDVR